MKSLLFFLALLISPSMAGDIKMPNGANCVMNNEVMPCWAMESPEANMAWYLMTHHIKPKPLTTRWVVLEAHEGCRRIAPNTFLCDPPKNAKPFTIDTHRVIIELGLRSDGVVVWR